MTKTTQAITYQDALFELGCEELPPKLVNKLLASLVASVSDGLAEQELSFESITPYASPRRIALLITQLQSCQPERLVERKGPALQAAFTEDGKATKAAEGFARSCGTTVDKLQKLETDKGCWLTFKAQQAGQTIQQLLPVILEKALKRLPIAKPMRWGDQAVQFARPVHWMILLYGKSVIEWEFFAVKAGNETYGHRFHAPQAITIEQPKDYVELLQKQGFVTADPHVRQTTICQQVTALAKGISATAVIEDALLEEVNYLVEWPQAYLCKFDDDFLKIPAEALIAAMQDHQKAFALRDKQDKLLPAFIAISNIQSKNEEQVRHGNEKVMRARLADAAFFYHADAKQALHERAEALKNVVFQANLGTLYDKSQRIKYIASQIAEHLVIDAKNIKRAAELCKTDLLTDMVGEFPELQGIMGYYYALQDKEHKDVAVALQEQYQPRFADDIVPTTLTGAILAIADRVDNLVSIFGINKAPTGEKDPFGLRRAAIGLLRILLECEIDINFVSLIDFAIASHQQALANNNVKVEVEQFIFDRLRYYYQRQEMDVGIINAVLACKPTNVMDFHKRMLAVQHFRQLAEAESLAIANKRVKNILQKEKSAALNGEIDVNLLQEQAERQLVELLNTKEKIVMPLYQQRNYVEMLSELASLRKPIDDFFDQVMVMAEDPALKQNRLRLLVKLQHLFSHVADISVLQ